MDRFQVPVQSADLLEDGELITQLRDEETSNIALLCDGYAYPFAELSGGEWKEERVEVLELTDPLDGEMPDGGAGIYELHFDECSYTLYVNESYTVSSEGTQSIILQIIDYDRIDVGFAESMSENIDGRWTEHSE